MTDCHEANETAPPDTLRKALGVAAEPEWENTNMASKKKTPTEQPTAETPQQTEAAPVVEKKAKPPKPEKAPKPEKKPREPKVKEEGLVVFALRMTEAERGALHKTAGPARASRFARTILVAAAHEDEAAFRMAIKDAREARA